jgi:hypothetical protein
VKSYREQFGSSVLRDAGLREDSPGVYALGQRTVDRKEEAVYAVETDRGVHLALKDDQGRYVKFDPMHESAVHWDKVGRGLANVASLPVAAPLGLVTSVIYLMGRPGH